MLAATGGNLPPVMPQGNVVEGLGREVRPGSPGELMVESSPSRQRRPPCKTNKEMSDEAADAAALTYLLTDLEDSSSEGEQSKTGLREFSDEYWENHLQEIWNQEFLNRQNWLLAEATYRGRLRDWFRASCQFIRESCRLRFDATLQEQEDWEELMDQFDHQAAVIMQMAIVAEKRRRNVQQHAGPSSPRGPKDEDVDEMRCDSTHSHLSREQLSKLPNSNSSDDTWADEVRSKGKSTRCPSCGECAKDCSCRRHISSLEDKMKELKKAVKERKRDDDSKWRGDGAKAGKIDYFGLKSEHYWAPWTSAGTGEPPSTYLLSCTYIGALRRSSHSGTPSFYWFTPSFYWKSWHFPC